MRFGTQAIVATCLTLVGQPIGAASAGGKGEWPALQRGEFIERFGLAAIPPDVMHLGTEGDCGDYKDESGKLFNPRVSFFRTDSDQEFVVVACSSIHNELTSIFERMDDGIKKHAFATTFGEGFYTGTWLENVSVTDAGSARMESFRREGACGFESEDFYFTYVFRDPVFLLIKVQSRNCNGGPWKTVYSTK